MKKTFFYLVIGIISYLAVSVLFTACEKSATDDENIENTTEIKGVYVAGTENGVAKLWKDGVAKNLTDGTHNAEALSVFVSDNDVYVVGFESNGSHEVAKLWKNNVPISLSTGNENARAQSVCVSGNDVYVAGYEGKVAKLWKNNVAQNLTNGDDDARAQSVYVSGNDVYIAGYDGKIAILWKNGVAQNLTDGSNEAMAFGVFLSDNDVYIAGYEWYETEWSPEGQYSYPIAKLWKNGVAQNISSSPSKLYSVFVQNNDVYVAGWGNHSTGIPPAVLWKNGVAQNLIEKGFANSIYSQNGDVYVAGEEWTGTVAEERIAILWKNGVAQRLGNIASAATSVFVKE